MLLVQGEMAEIERVIQCPPRLLANHIPDPAALDGMGELSAFPVSISVLVRPHETSHCLTSNQPVSDLCTWFISENTKETACC